jgi:hypothetical protein
VGTHSLVTGRLPALAGERCNVNKKLAGSIARPANEIVACRSLRDALRDDANFGFRTLAPAAAAPRCTATCAPDAPSYANANSTSAKAKANSTSAASDTDTASTGSAAATPTAAATTTASAEAGAGTGATASAAATAAALGQLHAVPVAIEILVVEEMEGGEADVGKLLFAERDHHTWYEIRNLLKVICRNSRCKCASC